MAKAGEDAKQAAQSSSKKKAAQQAEKAAKELNELADKAAEDSGYSLRKQEGAPEENGEQRGNESKPGQDGSTGKPSTKQQGVGKGAGDSKLEGQKLRGGSSSNWTRSRRKLGGGVLDDREGNVPEQYRGVVERYFEELSRQQANRKGQ